MTFVIQKFRAWAPGVALVLLVLQPLALIGYMRVESHSFAAFAVVMANYAELTNLKTMKKAIGISGDVALKTYGYASKSEFEAAYQKSVAESNAGHRDLDSALQINPLKLVFAIFIIFAPIPAVAILAKNVLRRKRGSQAAKTPSLSD